MSGKRAKMRYFPYIKQNSIAENVSTMGSFLVAGVGFEQIVKNAKCEHIPVQSHSPRLSPRYTRLCRLLALRTSLRENSHLDCFLSLTQRASLVGITRRSWKGKAYSVGKKIKPTARVGFIFLLRGWDFSLPSPVA